MMNPFAIPPTPITIEAADDDGEPDQDFDCGITGCFHSSREEAIACWERETAPRDLAEGARETMRDVAEIEERMPEGWWLPDPEDGGAR